MADNLATRWQLNNNMLATWAVDIELIFFTSITVKMIFRKRNDELMEITLRSQIIPYKEITLFLGMTLDSRLNLKEHIDKMRAKPRKTIKKGRLFSSIQRYSRRGALSEEAFIHTAEITTIKTALICKGGG